MDFKGLTESEMRQIQKWARATQIQEMLAFFDRLPRFVYAAHPVLLGSNNGVAILLAGVAVTSQVKLALRNVDEPFNPDFQFGSHIGRLALPRQQSRAAKAPVRVIPCLHRHFSKGFARVCLLKGSGECSQVGIRSHSIQRAAFKRHAKNGHVYQFDPLSEARDDEERVWPTLIGVKQATTFTGFCGRHDAYVFSAIENSPFQNTAEQRFLYHYRAFAQDYYARAHRFSPIESATKEMEFKLTPEEFAPLAKHTAMNGLDLDELTLQKVGWDADLMAKRWTAVDGYAFVGNMLPQVFATQFIAPRKDFQGRVVQDTKRNAPLDWVSLTITAAEDRALFLLCARKGSAVLSELVTSFRRLGPAERTKTIVAYVFCLFENFLILPNWWESQPNDVQLQFVNAFEARYYPRNLPVANNWELEEMAAQS